MIDEYENLKHFVDLRVSPRYKRITPDDYEFICWEVGWLGEKGMTNYIEEFETLEEAFEYIMSHYAYWEKYQ